MLSKFINALKKTRNSLTTNIRSILSGKTKLDDETLEELEEILIRSDIGVDTSLKLLKKLQTAVKKADTLEEGKLVEILKNEISGVLSSEEGVLKKNLNGPTVVLFVGVNGTGKTTSIAKLAHKLLQNNQKILLAACDTFRAAAIEQLEIWSKRLGLNLIKYHHGADPSAVAFDAAEAALARNIDYLLIDTAGRLHTKVNLMEELKKIKSTIQKKIPDAPHEILLVLDAVTGQNGLIQAKEFKKAVELTGVILTKLDGTAKGGIALSIKQELEIPIKYVGVGETLEDLQEFSSQEFATALFE